MGGSATTLTIDATSVSIGVYNLVLESYDNASSHRHTLKTDTIRITISEGGGGGDPIGPVGPALPPVDPVLPPADPAGPDVGIGGGVVGGGSDDTDSPSPSPGGGDRGDAGDGSERPC